MDLESGPSDRDGRMALLSHKKGIKYSLQKRNGRPNGYHPLFQGVCRSQRGGWRLPGGRCPQRRAEKGLPGGMGAHAKSPFIYHRAVRNPIAAGGFAHVRPGGSVLSVITEPREKVWYCGFRPPGPCTGRTSVKFSSTFFKRWRGAGAAPLQSSRPLMPLVPHHRKPPQICKNLWNFRFLLYLW